MENKFPRGKIALYMLGAAGAVILLIISITSFGWFVTSKMTQGNMAGFRATDLKFELASKKNDDVNGTNGSYNDYLSSEESTENVTVKVDGKSVTLNTTGEKSEIHWLMNGDSNLGNLNDDGIQPGCSGKLTFYVISKQDTELDLTFSLDTILYTAQAKPNNDNQEYILSSDDPAVNFVRGHILFFESCTDGIYSDRINGNTFTYANPSAKAGEAYPVDIYWVWPDVIDQLMMLSDDDCFKNRGYKKIIRDDDIGNNITDTSQMKADMAAYPQYYLDGSYTTEQLTEMLGKMSLHSTDISFDADCYKELNDSWNKADNIIGRNVGYIELRLTAEETSEAGT